MTLPLITVVSCGLSRLAKPCLDSVAEQLDVVVDHRCVFVDQQSPRLTKIENILSTLRHMPDDRIVALVDLDDSLYQRGALRLVAALHAAGAWLTYGSFRYADGRSGFAGPYAPGESVRTSRWRATHLKTFRAGLFNAIRHDDLKHPGEGGEPTWIDRADDVAFMLPMLEMAGHSRSVFTPEVLYTYDLSTSFEFTATTEERRHEKRIDQYVRGLPPYAQRETL